jgi:hypothetical protein
MARTTTLRTQTGQRPTHVEGRTGYGGGTVPDGSVQGAALATATAGGGGGGGGSASGTAGMAGVGVGVGAGFGWMAGGTGGVGGPTGELV